MCTVIYIYYIFIIGNVHRDIYKSCRTCLTDRAMSVRIAAANCLLEMLEFATFLYTTGIQSI